MSNHKQENSMSEMSNHKQENSMNEIIVNGITYVRADARPTGTRTVVVVDRGWIFAGDVTRENGRIRLSRCVWVFKWEKVGFSGVIANPSDADLRPIADVDIPQGAEIFSVPVPDGWGL